MNTIDKQMTKKINTIEKLNVNKLQCFFFNLKCLSDYVVHGGFLKRKCHTCLIFCGAYFLCDNATAICYIDSGLIWCMGGKGSDLSQMQS